MTRPLLSATVNHSKCGIKDAMMDDCRQGDDEGDKRCLRTDPENGVFDPFVRVGPPMKALERSKGFQRQAGVYELQRIGEHRSDGAQQDRPIIARRTE